MIEFKRTVFVFKLDGQQYEVKHPTVGQIESFQNFEGDDLEKSIKLLDVLGLPEDVARGMEAGHLKTIVDNIAGSPKK